MSDTAATVATAITTYEWWQVLILIVSVIFVLLIIAIVIIKVFSKQDDAGSISLFGFKIEKNKKPTATTTTAPATSVIVNVGQNDEIDGIDAHGDKNLLSACIDDTPSLGNELMLVISKSIRFGYETGTTKEIKLMRAQMNLAELKADAIKHIILKEFKNRVTQDKEVYDIFSQFLNYLIKSSLLDEYKRSFRENHLASIPDEDYEEIYCRDHLNRMLNKLKLEFYNFMPDCVEPAKMAPVFEKYEATFYNYAKEGLYEGRDIAIKYAKELREKTDSFDREILKISGIESVSKRVEEISKW